MLKVMRAMSFFLKQPYVNKQLHHSTTLTLNTMTFRILILQCLTRTDVTPEINDDGYDESVCTPVSGNEIAAVIVSGIIVTAMLTIAMYVYCSKRVPVTTPPTYIIEQSNRVPNTPVSIHTDDEGDEDNNDMQTITLEVFNEQLSDASPLARVSYVAPRVATDNLSDA